MSESIESVIAMGDLTDTTLFKALDGLWPVHGGALSAVWDAARAAARAAAQDAQYRRLCAYLEGSPIPPVEPLYGTEIPGDGVAAPSFLAARGSVPNNNGRSATDIVRELRDMDAPPEREAK